MSGVYFMIVYMSGVPYSEASCVIWTPWDHYPGARKVDPIFSSPQSKYLEIFGTLDNLFQFC